MDTFWETFFAGASLKANRLIKYTESQIGRHCNDRSDKCEVANNGHKCDTATEYNREIYSHRMECVSRVEFNHADRRVVIDNVDPECD